ncbi:hypothetical protein [Selenomonas sp.]|uniref:hypothetical protein n=1 Tax=Selenomonas sp. TaxID=2053611 RepID=UPI0025E397C4|nr:hypothetical protein [Selenomonas sp.]MBQ1868799.1 hypothetical protein [Selenomonas sp.]
MCMGLHGDCRKYQGADAMECLILDWLRQAPEVLTKVSGQEELPVIELTDEGAMLHGICLAAVTEAEKGES